MNICFITPEFVSENIEGGGLASYIKNISEILAEKGHRIIILTLSDVSERILWRENIYVERVRTCYPICKKLRFWQRCLFDSYYLNKRLRKLVKEKEKIDIVQYANYCALGVFRTKIPSVVRISSDSLLWRESNKEQFDLDRE